MDGSSSARPLKHWRAVAVAVDGRGTNAGGATVGRTKRCVNNASDDRCR